MFVLILFALLSSLVVSELFRRSVVARYQAQAATVRAIDPSPQARALDSAAKTN